MGSLRHRQARVPGWVVDAGWAVAVAVEGTIAIRVAREPARELPTCSPTPWAGRSPRCCWLAGAGPWWC